MPIPRVREVNMWFHKEGDPDPKISVSFLPHAAMIDSNQTLYIPTKGGALEPCRWPCVSDA